MERIRHATRLRTERHSARARWASLLLGAAAAFPALAASAEAPVFSHALHVGNMETPCSTCHVSKSDGPPQLLPSCADCHEDAETVQKYVPAARPPRLKLRFPHAAHEKPTPCRDCHQDLLRDDPTQPPAAFDTRRCNGCHAEKGLAGLERDCAACHGFDARKKAPADHRGAWATRHGAESEAAGFAGHGRDCATCHGASACDRCHRQVRPASHNGLWRLREHGTAAAWDSDRCKTCHETGTCVRCHLTTRPTNHVGAWRQMHGLAAGSQGDENCQACHRAAFCAGCHRTGRPQ